MQLVSPSEIGGKIMTLIEQADERLLIVSPFNDIRGWRRMRKAIEDAMRRRVAVIVVHRADKEPHGLSDLPLDFRALVGLHAKLYLSEKQGIITSMNLVLGSFEGSIDIAVATATEEEQLELQRYADRFLLREAGHGHTNYADLLWPEYFERYVADSAPSRVSVHKEYHPSTTCLKAYGLLLDGVRVGPWLAFDPNGIVSETSHYESGERTSHHARQTVGELSRYDIMFSLANVTGALYGVPINDLYFNSRIVDYVGRASAKLYVHLETSLSLPIHSRDHDTYQQIVDEIKLHMLGKCPVCARR